MAQNFTKFRRKQVVELRPYEAGESTVGIRIHPVDAKDGSPKVGDMIARDPDDHNDQWLVPARIINKLYEPNP